MHSPGPGQRIGGYELEASLGEGAMGSVFRARDADGGQVAVKLARPELAQSEEFTRRFRREYAAAARTSHPHLVPVLDQGEHEGLPFIVQRYMAGGSLADRLEGSGALAIEPAVELVVELAGAIDALHENGLVHRDLKPANVLMDEQGKAHVADLGLVKDRAGTVITRPGQALGTMDYMSPEQVRGEEVDGRSDVYSLACIAFACVAGAPPFAQHHGMQIMRAHLTEEPGDPCANRDDAPDGFGDAIRIGLAKEAGRRPATGAAYARLLRLAVSGVGGSGLPRRLPG